jgi:hypothetical protein
MADTESNTQLKAETVTANCVGFQALRTRAARLALMTTEESMQAVTEVNSVARLLFASISQHLLHDAALKEPSAPARDWCATYKPYGAVSLGIEVVPNAGCERLVHQAMLRLNVNTFPKHELVATAVGSSFYVCPAYDDGASSAAPIIPRARPDTGTIEFVSGPATGASDCASTTDTPKA